jgi:hypothetical protein
LSLQLTRQIIQRNNESIPASFLVVMLVKVLNV